MRRKDRYARISSYGLKGLNPTGRTSYRTGVIPGYCACVRKDYYARIAVTIGETSYARIARLCQRDRSARTVLIIREDSGRGVAPFLRGD